MATALEIKAQLQVLKPVHEVFEAIVDPAKMSNYFISKGSSRIDEEGKVIHWNFPEFKDSFPIKVGKTEKDKLISFYWTGVDQKEHLVEINLTPGGGDKTIIVVTEKGGENTEAGLKWFAGNTEGWANFLACLKAYTEYGINLRKGAFDFLGDQNQ